MCDVNECCQWLTRTHAHRTHVHASMRTVSVTIEREMAPFAPTFIIQQGCNAIWALLRRQLTLIFLPPGSRRIKTCYDCRLLLRFGSSWFNLVQFGSIWFQSLVLKAASRLAQLVQSGLVVSKFKIGSHNDIIITFMHKSSHICIKTVPFLPRRH